jgi:hypothetical protein
MDRSSTCDPLLLTEVEAKALRTEFQRRTRASCENGLASCGPLALNPSHLNSIHAAFQVRYVDA